MKQAKMTRSGAAVFAAIVIAVGACGSGEASVVESEREALVESYNDRIEQLDALTASYNDKVVELDTTKSALDDAEETIEERDTEIGSLKEDLNGSAGLLASTRNELSSAQAGLDELEDQLSLAVERAETAEAEATSLNVLYNPQIRADAETAWAAELKVACSEAGETTGAIASHVDFTNQLSIVGTKAELVDEVSACAEPIRNRSEQQKLDAECEVADGDAIIRDTAGLSGNCYILYTVAFQWDSRTGPCNFLGNFGGRNLGTRSWRYDDTGLFRAVGSTMCDQLDGADQDDLLKLYVDLEGPYRYDTAAGGTNEVPEFSIRKATLVQKA